MILLQQLSIDALSFLIWEENFGYFWRCRSLEDGSIFKSPLYRKLEEVWRDIHLYALRHRIAAQEFPGIVCDFKTDRILAHNQVAAKIFSLTPQIQEEKADASKYWKQKQKAIDHKRELILNKENIVSLDLFIPGGLSLGISTRDELYELPGNQIVIVTNVFELDFPLIGASSSI